MGVRASRGFTLPELLIVTTVLAVLLAMGVPAFVDMVRNQRVKSASFDLFSSLSVARSEAILRNTQVTVTPSSSSNWANGWRITYVDGTSTITVRESGSMPNITISGPTTLVYRGSGRLNGTSTAQFELTASGTNVTTRCIRVDLSGRPITKATAC